MVPRSSVRSVPPTPAGESGTGYAPGSRWHATSAKTVRSPPERTLPPTAAQAFRRRVKRRAGADPDTLSLATLAPAISTPALFMHDPEDPHASYSSVTETAAAWPGAKLVPTPGLGTTGCCVIRLPCATLWTGFSISPMPATDDAKHPSGAPTTGGRGILEGRRTRVTNTLEHQVTELYKGCLSACMVAAEVGIARTTVLRILKSRAVEVWIVGRREPTWPHRPMQVRRCRRDMRRWQQLRLRTVPLAPRR